MKKISICCAIPVTSQPKTIWKYYIDISLRKLWELDLEEFSIFGELKSGTKGTFKLQDAPKMEVILSTVIPEQEFTKQFNIPDMGILYFSHQIEVVSQTESIIKSVISLLPNENVNKEAYYSFLKHISDDILDKAFKLKELVEQ
ncbi:hypothetical protein [Snodgrassella alvi]|uniref:hypothetical protein n=1 Tax=Snodgrassella alvi TaxID=1196083 RepID=UPI000C1F06C3|nr:hypothetical protein [Snodgrassella alvi]PIT48330.1 hypothetical protein BHC51_04860 [Snodgrassella alvi]